MSRRGSKRHVASNDEEEEDAEYQPPPRKRRAPKKTTRLNDSERLKRLEQMLEQLISQRNTAPASNSENVELRAVDAHDSNISTETLDPSEPIPIDFQILQDSLAPDSGDEINLDAERDEEEDEEENEVVDEFIDGETVDMEDVEITEVPMYIQGANGSLTLFEANVEEDVQYFDSQLYENEEIENAREELLRCISPVHPSGNCSMEEPSSENATVDASPQFLIEELNQQKFQRGLVATRGRGRGGRRSQRRIGGRNQNGWVRGEPLIECYVRDDELPEQMRLEIQKLQDDRRARSTKQAEKRASEGENMIDGNQDVEEFYNEQEFVWQPMSEWKGVKETFVPKKTGPTKRFKNAYDAFRAFWGDDIVSHIASATNRNAQKITEARERFGRDWYETNADEIFLLFAFWMMLGIIKMPTIKSCFTREPLLQAPVFRGFFNESRYWNLNSALHFAEESPKNPTDLIHPIRPVVDHLNKKFKKYYNLNQDICIDESLVLWKGPLAFKQYIKTKSARWGVKSYHLCESTTGYLWSFFIYVGRMTYDSTLPSSVSCVLKLLQPILGLGHTLYMDNWFNSPLLARFLKKRRTDCVGTLQQTRKHVPPEIQKAELNEGEFMARQSGDVMLVSVQEPNRKRLTLISTHHGVSQSQKVAKAGGSPQYKLDLVRDYNKMMGGVDLLDGMLEAYLVERKQCLNWSKKMFKRLLNISIQNARILVEKSTNTKIDSLTFRLELVRQIKEKHFFGKPAQTDGKPENYAFSPNRLLKDCHFVRTIPITDEIRARYTSRSKMGRQRCIWCIQRKRKRVLTRYYCPQCDVALCLANCFEQYHTVR